MGLKDGAPVDPLLTQYSNGLYLDDTDFIGEAILPSVAVGTDTGKLAGYGNGHLRIVNTSHAGKGKYLEVETLVTAETSYEVEEHGLFEIVTAKQKRNAITPYNALEDATQNLTHLHRLAKEKALADTLTGGSVITQGATLSGNSQYNKRDHADSNPIEDRITAFGTVEDATGTTPNVAIMSQKVARNLRFHAQLLDALGYKWDRPNGLTMQELADALEVDKVLIGRALYNTAKEGQTDAFSPVWGNDLIYATIAQNIGLKQKTLGIEVRLNGQSPREVTRKEISNPKGATELIVTDEYDQLITEAACGYLIQDAIA